MSSFGMRRLIGVPRVCPSKTPDRICTVSDSLRCDTRALCPGARRSRSGWMSASDRGSRGGRSEEHTSELQSRENLVCRLLLEKKKKRIRYYHSLIIELKQN